MIFVLFFAVNIHAQRSIPLPENFYDESDFLKTIDCRKKNTSGRIVISWKENQLSLDDVESKLLENLNGQFKWTNSTVDRRKTPNIITGNRFIAIEPQKEYYAQTLQDLQSMVGDTIDWIEEEKCLTVQSVINEDDYQDFKQQYFNEQILGPNQGPNISLEDKKKYWNLSKIQIYQAWTLEAGSSFLKGAIIDSGISLEHLDPEVFSDRIISPYDFVNDDDDPQDDLKTVFNGVSSYGHGTQVASTWAAKYIPGKVSGIDQKIKIIPIKVVNSNGSFVSTKLYDALTYALDKGAKIINLSFSGNTATNMHRYIDSKKAIYIAAAGNNGELLREHQRTGIGFPAARKATIAVSAFSKNDSIASYSAFGDEVDIGAPEMSWAYDPKGNIVPFYGTSAATPHISGVISLAYASLKRNSFNLELSTQMARTLLWSGAKDKINKAQVGHDQSFGMGSINAFRVLQLTRLNQTNEHFSVEGQYAGLWKFPSWLNIGLLEEENKTTRGPFVYLRSFRKIADLQFDRDFFNSRGTTSIIHLNDESKTLEIRVTDPKINNIFYHELFFKRLKDEGPFWAYE